MLFDDKRVVETMPMLFGLMRLLFGLEEKQGLDRFLIAVGVGMLNVEERG